MIKIKESINDHYTTKCKHCEKVLGTCRCSFPSKKIIYTICDECKSKGK